MSESILLKTILDEFFVEIEKDGDIPEDIKTDLKNLRKSGKLAVGTNLTKVFEDKKVDSNENSKN